MNDRELLEKAAKAAGLELRWHDSEGDVWCWIPTATPPHNRRAEDQTRGTIWNPLTDDGDAFALMARLRLIVECGYLTVEVRWNPEDTDNFELHGEVITEIVRDFDGQNGGSEATRRAIVRAAAALGEQK